jgi:glutathione S-transferase
MRLYDYAASGNCFKVRLLLGMLGRSYERVPVDIFAGDTLTDAYGAINPLRETPVLELDGGERLAQSSAILWYLAEGTPFLPEDRLDRGRVAQWLSFEQERVMGGLGNPRFRLLTGRLEPGDPRIESRLETGRGALSVLDAHLAGRSYVVGERPTIADLGLFPYVSVAGDAGVDLNGFPQVSAWLDRIRALPGFVDDFVTYPENARPEAAISIY